MCSVLAVVMFLEYSVSMHIWYILCKYLPTLWVIPSLFWACSPAKVSHSQYHFHLCPCCLCFGTNGNTVSGACGPNASPYVLHILNFSLQCILNSFFFYDRNWAFKSLYSTHSFSVFPTFLIKENVLVHTYTLSVFVKTLRLWVTGLLSPGSLLCPAGLPITGEMWLKVTMRCGLIQVRMALTRWTEEQVLVGMWKTGNSHVLFRET